MPARRILRPCKLQHPPGEFIAFARGQVLAADYEHIGHWFIVENSVEIPDAPTAEPVTESPEEIAKDEALAGQGVTRESLLAQAKELAIDIDGRWGLAKLQAAIDAHLAS